MNSLDKKKEGGGLGSNEALAAESRCPSCRRPGLRFEFEISDPDKDIRSLQPNTLFAADDSFPAALALVLWRVKISIGGGGSGTNRSFFLTITIKGTRVPTHTPPRSGRRLIAQGK